MPPEKKHNVVVTPSTSGLIDREDAHVPAAAKLDIAKMRVSQSSHGYNTSLPMRGVHGTRNLCAVCTASIYPQPHTSKNLHGTRGLPSYSTGRAESGTDKAKTTPSTIMLNQRKKVSRRVVQTALLWKGKAQREDNKLPSARERGAIARWVEAAAEATAASP